MATGKTVKVKKMDKGRYEYRGHVKDFMISFDTNTISKRTWRVYSDSDDWDNKAVYEMSARIYRDKETDEGRYMTDQIRNNRCTTFRRWFRFGDSYDVLGDFGKIRANTPNGLICL